MQHQRKEVYPLIQEFITEYREKYGIAPSLKEISARIGMPYSTTGRYVKRMEEQGTIERTGARMIFTETERKSAEQYRQIPKVGSISCGLPLLAEENIEEYYSLPRTWVGTGNVFILQAEGQSMINAGIDNGDYVIIRQQPDAELGQIIVALVDNEAATLKRYRPHLEDNTVELVPENDAYDTQVIDLSEHTLEIQGVAVGVFKSFEKCFE